MVRVENKKRTPKNEIKYSLHLNEEQRETKRLISERPVTFIHGRAGSGKTLVAVLAAIDLFFKGTVQKVVMTRPTVGTEDNGFLPGSFHEKLEPWLVPLRDNLRKVYNFPEKLRKMEEHEQIEIVALTHFRGRTFDNAVCIIDEYQNLTAAQLSMAIGRLGKDSFMIFCGDVNQNDLRDKSKSAAARANLIKDSQFVNVCQLVENHRHPAVKELLELLEC